MSRMVYVEVVAMVVGLVGAIIWPSLAWAVFSIAALLSQAVRHGVL